ncbi:MAG TPA: hypothetical protein V6C84_28475 [Coleofasciculaceae cyanobacterium]|jgi:integrase
MRQINPVNNNGSIQLKFSVSGKRYSLNPVPGGTYGATRDMQTATAIATRITNDILSGHFDATLDSYRVSPKAVKVPELPKPDNLLALWDAWVASLDISEATRANHYNGVRRMILKANPGTLDTLWLTQAKLAPSSFNIRLSFMRTCGTWGLSQGFLEANPYSSLKSRKGSPRKPQPFTLEEVRAILGGFQALHPHYLPFVKFLLATGVRTSEAVGYGGVLWISQVTP